MPVTNVGDSALSGNTSLTSIVIPKSVKEIGADGKWQGLTMICKVSKFPVEVAVNGEGSVTGAGLYAPGDSVTLTVTPAEGFVFCGWSDSSAKSATYAFTMHKKMSPVAKAPLLIHRQIIPRGKTPLQNYLLATRGKYRL